MRCAVVSCVLALATPLCVHADVKLPAILSSHMVLQREMPVPIWGTAKPGEKVTVKFRDQTKTTEADKDGKWSVKLDALKAGGPDSVTVTGANTLTLDDVLVGEVWIGSGQSNMDGRVNGYAKNDPGLVKVVEGTPYPQVRLAKATGGWKVADKAASEAFSALLLPFGVRLNQELGVPVGLMLGAVGGTPSGAWLDDEMFKADPLCQEQLKKAAAKYDPEKVKAAYAAALKKWEADAEKAKAENKKPPAQPAKPLAPGEIRGGRFGYLYEPHIKPMAPFAVRGVLWDQGESGTSVEGVDQFAVMGALIRGWRKAWGQDFAFLSVQKPSGGGPAFDPADPVTNQADKFAPLPAAVPTASIANYRELHLNLRQHPNTFLVIASDLGSGIHPANKSGYGYRSARVALGGVYGKKIEIYGPIYKSHKIEGDKVRVTFSHVGGGLAFKQGAKLQGFAVAGEDNKFQWADATIDGDSVVLSNPKVAKPVAVRYAWANTHPWANLFNADGLPALPFKTDTN
jgi:sialate O-acetylesterase